MRYLICFLVIFGTAQVRAQDFIIALTGADCYTCELSLNSMLHKCLEHEEVLFVFPETYENERHWAKDIKARYTPHIFSDSLFEAVINGYPLSIMARMDESGSIVRRYIVKETQCADLDLAQPSEDNMPLLDSLDFNRYMTGYSSSISFQEGKYVIISNGRQVRVLDTEQRVLYRKDLSELSEDLAHILREIGFGETLIKLNLEDDFVKSAPLGFFNAHLEGDKLRVLGVVRHLEKPDTLEDGNVRLYLNQIQLVFDFDLTTSEYEVKRFPFSIPELEEGHYYSLSGAKFIDHNHLLVSNSLGRQVHDDRNQFGIVGFADDLRPIYRETNYVLPNDAPRSEDGISIRYDVVYYQDANGVVYMHTNRDNTLVTALGEQMTLSINTSGFEHPNDSVFSQRPWIERVVNVDGNVIALVIDSDKHTHVISDEGRELFEMEFPARFIGQDEAFIYLHRSPITGVVYRLRKSKL